MFDHTGTFVGRHLGNILTLEENLACIRCIDTAYHVHHGCFTGTVGANQSINSPLLKCERNILCCRNTTKALADAIEL